MERLKLSQELARDILVQAKSKGASQGDVVMLESESFFVAVRLGEVEKISQAQEKRLGLRLFFGSRSATASTSDISRESIERLVDDTCAMARSTAQDSFGGLPLREDLVRTVPDLDLVDNEARSMSVEAKTRLACDAEGRALSVDPRISNSEGAEFSDEVDRVIYANSHDFFGEYRGSTFSLSVVPVAKLNGSMQRDFWYSSRRKVSCLESPETIGEKAAQRVLRRLGARKVKTQEVPVIFDPLTARSLMRQLSSALSGYSLYKGASFLVGKLGQRIASDLVTVVDDGTIPAALGSKPFDAEGLSSRRKFLLTSGILQSYLLDSYSGRKLGYASTGNASRSVGGPPGVAPTNFHLSPGSHSREEIIESIENGFYVTELMGFGVNLVTGDYSRGAAGLWIHKGQLAYPVEEVTIAGNLKDMLLNIEMIGNDLELRDAISSPTIKISRMTVAGD
jgi:PmbA protein